MGKLLSNLGEAYFIKMPVVTIRSTLAMMAIGAAAHKTSTDFQAAEKNAMQAKARGKIP